MYVEWSSIPRLIHLTKPMHSFNSHPFFTSNLNTRRCLGPPLPPYVFSSPSPLHHLPLPSSLPSTPPPMGNFVSFQETDGGDGGGKVVLSDGTVHEFDRPISAAELMLEHPRQFVVDMHSLSAGGTRVTPLPADHTLDPDKSYLMIPMTRGKLSADEARRILSLARSVLRSRSPPSLAKKLSLVSGICMEDVAVKEKKELAARKDDRLMEREEKVGGFEWSPEVFGSEPEFLSRQFSTKGWKPSLRTIEEKTLVRKVSHWLF